MRHLSLSKKRTAEDPVHNTKDMRHRLTQPNEFFGEIYGSSTKIVKGAAKKTWRILCHTIRIYGEIDVEQRAAAFGYYALFSLVPLVALLFAFGSPIFSRQEVFHTLRHIAPLGQEELNFLWQLVERMEKARGSVSAVSIVILLWASLRFFQALVCGVNRAWHSIEIRWWEGPLKNLAMVATLASAVILGILAPVVLQAARNIAYSLETLLLKSYFSRLYPHIDLHFVFSIVDLGRYVLSTGVLFYAFCMLYMLAPRRRVLFSQVWLPALLVTIFVQLSQILFVNYLHHFINYNYVYGALGGLMFLLMWIYFCGLAILGGGCMCAAQGRVAEEIGSLPSNKKSPHFSPNRFF